MASCLFQIAIQVIVGWGSHSCRSNYSNPGRITKVRRGSLKFLFSCLLLLTLCYLAEAQVFPLKISDDGRYITTKRQIPFLLTGSSFELAEESTEEVVNKLNRVSTYGFNTLFISLNLQERFLNRKGQTVSFTRYLSALKHVAREAALRNMAVVVAPNNNNILNLPVADKKSCIALLFEKMRKFRNIIWLFEDSDSISLQIFSANKTKQLIAVNCINPSEIARTSKCSPDLLFFSAVTSLKPHMSKPAILIIPSGANSNDSIFHINRRNAYAAILNGMCGVVMDRPASLKSQKKTHNTYFSVSNHLKQFKSVLDTLPWNAIDRAQIVVPSSSSSSESVFQAIHRDSSLAIIYITSAVTLSLDLSFFQSDLKFIWIDPTSGKQYCSQIKPYPDKQMFLPPVSGNNRNDWLLIIHQYKQKNNN